MSWLWQPLAESAQLNSAVNYTLTCYPGEYGINTENQITYSEEFDNAAWTKSSVTTTTNAAQSPQGETTAEKLIENNAVNSGIIKQGTPVSGAVFSVYAKKGEWDRACIGISNGVGYWAVVNFNLTSGTAGYNASWGGVTVSSPTITPVGSGWYRCAVTVGTISGTGLESYCIAPFNQDGDPSAPSPPLNGDGTSGIYIWGAQVNTSAIKPYVKTTSSAASAPTVTLLRSKLITASAGSYAYTGVSAILTKGGLSNYVLTALAGSYSISGKSAIILRGRTLTAQAGSYAYTGQSANILRVKRIVASAGAYTYSGQSATLLRSKVLAASAGSYAYTGQNATISKSNLLVASAGSYAYTGVSATISKSTAVSYVLLCSTGSYSISGGAASITIAPPTWTIHNVSGVWSNPAATSPDWVVHPVTDVDWVEL